MGGLVKKTQFTWKQEHRSHYTASKQGLDPHPKHSSVGVPTVTHILRGYCVITHAAISRMQPLHECTWKYAAFILQ